MRPESNKQEKEKQEPSQYGIQPRQANAVGLIKKKAPSVPGSSQGRLNESLIAHVSSLRANKGDKKKTHNKGESWERHPQT